MKKKYIIEKIINMQEKGKGSKRTKRRKHKKENREKN